VAAFFVEEFQAIIIKASEVARKAAEAKVEIVFRRFDEDLHKNGSYGIDDLHLLQDDLDRIFKHIPKQLTESKLGSERSAALMAALHKRLPPVYQKLIVQFQNDFKRKEKNQKEIARKQVSDMKRQTKKLQRTLEDERKNNAYYSDESSESDYNS